VTNGKDSLILLYAFSAAPAKTTCFLIVIIYPIHPNFTNPTYYTTIYPFLSSQQKVILLMTDGKGKALSFPRQFRETFHMIVKSLHWEKLHKHVKTFPPSATTCEEFHPIVKKFYREIFHFHVKACEEFHPIVKLFC